MTKTIKWSTIVSKSKQIKSNVEKNQAVIKLPNCNTAETVYVLNKAVLNPGKDVTLNKSYANCKKPTGTGINKKLNKSQYKDCSTRLVRFMDENNKSPNFITFGSEKISLRLSIYCCSKIIVSYDSKKELPSEALFRNHVFYVNSKYGHATKSGCNNMGQNNDVKCGPHSMQECIRNLTGKVISQETLASWAGTTSGGTSHAGLETAIAKAAKELGVKFSVKWYNFSELGWNGIKKILDSKNQDCIIHNLYRNQWGHYEVINAVNDNNINVQNSLGSYCSNGCFCGYIEYRTKSEFRSYISGISQKSVLVITRG